MKELGRHQEAMESCELAVKYDYVVNWLLNMIMMMGTHTS
ncbi:hypothetical protein [Orientia tsutsugamushi]